MSINVTPSTVHRVTSSLEDDLEQLARDTGPISFTPDPAFRVDQFLVEVLPQLDSRQTQLTATLTELAQRIHDSADAITQAEESSAVAAGTMLGGESLDSGARLAVEPDRSPR